MPKTATDPADAPSGVRDDNGRVSGKEMADTGRACGRCRGSARPGWTSVATTAKEVVTVTATLGQRGRRRSTRRLGRRGSYRGACPPPASEVVVAASAAAAVTEALGPSAQWRPRRRKRRQRQKRRWQRLWRCPPSASRGSCRGTAVTGRAAVMAAATAAPAQREQLAPGDRRRSAASDRRRCGRRQRGRTGRARTGRTTLLAWLVLCEGRSSGPSA